MSLENRAYQTGKMGAKSPIEQTEAGSQSALDHAEPPATFRFAQEEFQPLLSGAMYWPSEAALVVADLHLEKLSSFARSGQFLPPYDSYATLRKVANDIKATGAKKVICAGDSFHRDEGTMTLPPDALALLQLMIAEVEWIWIAGNHDPSAHNLGGVCVPDMECRKILFTHEPVNSDQPVVAGHLHPAARVFINGRSARRPCFALDDKLLMMPAYGTSTGSLNILSAPFSGLFDLEKIQVHMLGKSKIYPVHPRRLVKG